VSTEPTVTLGIPCRTDEPALGRTLDAAWSDLRTAAGTTETLVCLNGRAAGRSPAARDLDAFARRVGARLVMHDVDREPERPAGAEPADVVALTTERAGKAIAWNVLRRWARGATTVFLDADVDIGAGSIARLLDALAAAPDAVLASPKTSCAPRPTAFERIMAAPYGVDFPNLSGQLYAARSAGLPPTMPEDLIEPERWLELAVGRERVVRDPVARVVVRLPATLGDFYRQRIRIEMGKVQIDAQYPALLARGNPQPRGWTALRALSVPDLGRLGVYLVLRESAHVVAWWRYRRRRTEGVWIQAASTKQWTA